MISFTVQAEKRTYVFDLPERWEDLSPEQYCEIVRLQLVTPKLPSDTEKDIFFIGLLRHLMPLPKEDFYQLPIEVLKTEYAIGYQFLEEPSTFQSLLPYLQVDDVKLPGPQDKFSYISLEQMALVEIFMENYCEEPSEAMLNNMVAAMYYPYPTKNGEVEKETLYAHAEKVAALPLHIRMAAYLNYRSLRNYIPERCYQLFGDSSGSSSGKTTAEQYEDLYSSLAKGGPQEEETVKRVPAIRALRWLNNELETKKAQADAVKRN